MYILSKLSKKSIDFVSQTMGAGANRSEFFAIAVAYCVSRELALPPAEVRDLTDYYRNLHSNSVLSTLSDINDVLPHDSKLSRGLVESFYKYRYQAANPKVIPLAFSKGSGIVDFFGLSTIFGEDFLKKINDAGGELSSMIGNVTDIIEDIRRARLSNAAASQATEQNDRYVA